MSTYINVTLGDGGLLGRVKGQQEAARFAFAEQQRLKELEAEKARQDRDKEQQGRKLPVQQYKRELIAHRHPGKGGLFTMHAVGAQSNASNWDWTTYLYPLERPGSSPSASLHTPWETYPGSLDIHYYIGRSRYLLLPIDNDHSIFVIHWQTASALEGTWTGDLTAHVATTFSECYVVSRTAIRKLTMPQALKDRLDYVYPPLPDPKTKGDPWPVNSWFDDPLLATTDIAAHGLLCGYGLGRYDQWNHGMSQGNKGALEYSGTRVFSPGVYTFLLDYQRQLDWQPSLYSSYASVASLLPINQFGNLFIHADLQWKDPTYYLTQLKQTDAWASRVSPVNTGTLLTIQDPPWKRVPKLDVKAGVPRDLSVPTGWNYGSSHPMRSVYMSTNWGNKAYCLAQLTRLGFTPADLKP